MRYWTPEEEETLAELITKLPPHVIANNSSQFEALTKESLYMNGVRAVTVYGKTNAKAKNQLEEYCYRLWGTTSNLHFDSRRNRYMFGRGI